MSSLAASQNSNLVLTAENRDRRRGEEGTGEVESLYGRLGNRRMGDKVAKERPPEVRRERHEEGLVERETWGEVGGERDMGRGW